MKRVFIALTIATISYLTADIKNGESVYKAYCAICHTIDGRGGMGPDFNMVSYMRHKEEIEYYAKEPNKLFKAFGYKSNAMPTLDLTDKERKDVAEYISSLQPFKKWMIKKKKKNKSENNSSNTK